MQTSQDLTASATKAYRLQELKLFFFFILCVSPSINIFIKPVFIASY